MITCLSVLAFFQGMTVISRLGFAWNLTILAFIVCCWADIDNVFFKISFQKAKNRAIIWLNYTSPGHMPNRRSVDENAKFPVSLGVCEVRKWRAGFGVSHGFLILTRSFWELPLSLPPPRGSLSRMWRCKANKVFHCICPGVSQHLFNGFLPGWGS